MSKTLSELRAASEEQLIKEHDQVAKNTLVGTQYYLDELVRRDSLQLAKQAAQSTRRVEYLTWVIAGLTLVNVVAIVLG